MTLEEYKKDRREIIIPILQGLLASGHYTAPGQYSSGGDWESPCVLNTHSPIPYYPDPVDCAVQDAIEIADQLDWILGSTYKNEQP